MKKFKEVHPNEWEIIKDELGQSIDDLECAIEDEDDYYINKCYKELLNKLNQLSSILDYKIITTIKKFFENLIEMKKLENENEMG